MFRHPIPRAFLRVFRPSSPQLLVPRIANGLPRLPPSKTTLPVGFSSKIHTPSKTAHPSLPRTTVFIPHRAFSGSPRRALRAPYGSPYGRYNRFDQGPGGGHHPSIPHIVIFLVGGAGVFYVYNLETVEVRLISESRIRAVEHSDERRTSVQRPIYVRNCSLTHTN